jgi:hypothetical protein
MPARIAAFAVIFVASIVQVRAQADEPAPPQLGKEIPLFNGKDLTGFYTWFEKTGLKDPAGIASAKDGVLRIGAGDNGYVATQKPYKDYHLAFEYKWGELKEPSKYVRNSGLLLHGHGPDGAAGKRWISSVECQLAQGCEGDFILIRGKDEGGKPIDSTISAYVTLGSDKSPRWDPKDGKLTKYSGRQFWWNKHEVGFEELIDTRGKEDAASPLGEWTKVEATCAGDKITIKINGKPVNECVAVSPAEGKICFQGEGYEILFRNIKLHELMSN